MKMEIIDTAIIGAGVVGLAIAAELSKMTKDIFLIERNQSFGQEISSRSSEVIHAGIYYTKSSLKARLCVEGNRLLYELCEKERIPFLRCGKLIVGCDKEEEKELELLKEKALANGVDDILYITKRQIEEYEPNIRALSALYSPNTGIIDSHKLMKYFANYAKRNGVNFIYNTKVVNIEKIRDGAYEVSVIYPDGERFSFITNRLINCAGLEADKIAASVGIDIDACNYRQYFWKGEYFSLNIEPNFIKRLIYPVPNPNNTGLGIHATIDLSGRVKLGPNAIYMEERDYDFSVNMDHRYIFYEAAKRYLPSILLDDLAPDMAGIRPTLRPLDNCLFCYPMVLKGKSPMKKPLILLSKKSRKRG